MHYSIEVKKFIIFVIMAKLMFSHRASGFIANISEPSSCQGSTATIYFNFNLEGGSIVPGSKVWLFNRTTIAEDTGSGFTALNNYTSRLTSHSGDGLTLSNVTTADAGTYEYEILLVAGFTPKTATASFTVHIGPLNASSPLGCLVKASQSGNTVKCTVSGNCGTPPLIPSWVNVTTTDQFECKDSGTYQCCATGAVLPSCYSGSSNDFCTQFNCKTTTTITMTTTTTVSTTNTETRTASTGKTRTEKTASTENTNTGIGTESTIATSSCPLPVLVIAGISFSGFLSILLIIIICCCCPCCCLYHCRKEKDTDKFKTDLVETNDNEDSDKHTKANVQTPNPAYVQVNAPNELSTSDQFKDVQLDDGTLKALIRSNGLAANLTTTSNKDVENKPVPNKNEVIESEQL